MTKIVANMIGRNESDHYLEPVLERLTHQVDLITFTDDASDDNTAAIAKSYGAIVQTMDSPTFNTDEGKLRQASWEHLERQIAGSNDNWWVLAIDCDEMLYEVTYKLRELAEDPHEYDVCNIQFFHMWNEHQFRIDKAWRPHGSTRYFRYYPGGRFMDRALACGSEPTYVRDKVQEGRYFLNSGLCMKHLSYIKDDDKKAKYERYSKIDGGAFHANAHIESIMDPDPVLRDWIYDTPRFR